MLGSRARLRFEVCNRSAAIPLGISGDGEVARLLSEVETSLCEEKGKYIARRPERIWA